MHINYQCFSNIKYSCYDSRDPDIWFPCYQCFLQRCQPLLLHSNVSKILFHAFRKSLQLLHTNTLQKRTLVFFELIDFIILEQRSFFSSRKRVSSWIPKWPWKVWMVLGVWCTRNELIFCRSFLTSNLKAMLDPRLQGTLSSNSAHSSAKKRIDSLYPAYLFNVSDRWPLASLFIVSSQTTEVLWLGKHEAIES